MDRGNIIINICDVRRCRKTTKCRVGQILLYSRNVRFRKTAEYRGCARESPKIVCEYDELARTSVHKGMCTMPGPLNRPYDTDLGCACHDCGQRSRNAHIHVNLRTHA